MNLIDILILAFVMVGALHGYQRGLISSVLGLLSNVIGFIVASWQYVAALQWAEQYFPLRQGLESFIYRTILSSVQAKATSGPDQQSAESFLGILPSEWGGLWESLAGIGIPQAVEQVTHQLAAQLSERILSLVAFVCVFYLTVFVLQLIFYMILRPFGKWGGSLNRGGGLLFGSLSALIGLSVVAGLLWPFFQMGVGGSFNALVLNSFCYTHLLEIFRFLDQAFAAQISQEILEPLIQGQGIWFNI